MGAFCWKMAAPEKDVWDDRTINKYQQAAVIANTVMGEISAAAVPGAKIADLCVMGDKSLEAKTATAFKSSKDMKKGIAFPTSISVNNCIGHCSPLPGDKKALKEGDLYKIDLGVHLDGYCSVFGFTGVCVDPAKAPEAVTGKK